MSEEKIITEVSDGEKIAMQRVSAEALPINPSAAGWKPTAIRDALWKAIYGTNASVLELLERVIREVNAYIDSHATEQSEAIEGLVPITRTVNGYALSEDISLKKADVGLGNVDDTSDMDKPVSNAMQAKLDEKMPITAKINGKQIKDNPSIAKEDIDLGNVENTADLDKPISRETQAALDGKADISEVPNHLYMSLDNETYQLKIALKNKNNETIGGEKMIDLPIEALVSYIEYDEDTSEIVVRLHNGTETRIDVLDMFVGLVPTDRTIAGFDLKDDITVEELYGALHKDVVTITNVYQSNLSTESGGENIFKVVLSNGEIAEFKVYNGRQGEQGLQGPQGEQYILTEDDKTEIAQEAANLVFVPTKISDLEDDSAFIDKSVKDLDNYYDKENSYSREQIDNNFASRAEFEAHCSTALARRVLTAGQYERDENGTVRLTLTDGDGNSVSPVNGTIYLIPAAKYGTNSIYEEYLFFNSSSGDIPLYILELIGTTEAHFEDYYKKEETYPVVKKVDGTSVANLLDVVYPVGSIYMSVTDTNPETLFGFGTWEQIKDRFLLSVGDTYAEGKEGGEATHILTKDELPNIVGELRMHSVNSGTNISNAGGDFNLVELSDGAFGYRDGGTLVPNGSNTSAAGFTLNIGKNQPHENMPPYLAVYMWKRTG